jgi:hypothetical protein
LTGSQPMDREHKPQHPYTPPSLNISEEKKTK